MINMTFISSRTPAIQKKAVKGDGILGMPLSVLVEIAFKVFHSQDKAQETKEQWKMKQEDFFLAAALAQEHCSQRTNKDYCEEEPVPR